MLEQLEAIIVGFLIALVKAAAAGQLSPPPSTAEDSQSDAAMDGRRLQQIREARAQGLIP